MKAIVIREPYVSLILAGEKTWEMRKTACRYRGPVALIGKGSGTVIGTAEIVDSLPAIASPEAYAAAELRHRVPPSLQQKTFSDGWRTPWVLAKAARLVSPVSYSHPCGAVIWVSLDDDVAAAITAQLRDGLIGAPQCAVHSEPVAARSMLPNVPAAASSARTRSEGKIFGDEAHVTLTSGNIRNNHFYLRPVLEFFPSDAIGGCDGNQIAKVKLKVTFSGLGAMETDITGPDWLKRPNKSNHCFFRERSPVREFLERNNAEEGDTVVIHRRSLLRYEVTLKKDSL